MATRIKGMYDILPPDSLLWRRIENAFLQAAGRYGFAEARTPAGSNTPNSSPASLGDTTDIVEKEMYTFLDKSRAQPDPAPRRHGLDRPRLRRKFGVRARPPLRSGVYLGPMYRYERPQKGPQPPIPPTGCGSFRRGQRRNGRRIGGHGHGFLQGPGLGIERFPGAQQPRRCGATAKPTAKSCWPF